MMRSFSQTVVRVALSDEQTIVSKSDANSASLAMNSEYVVITPSQAQHFPGTTRLSVKLILSKV
jgi:hypothetical protein